jgi:hypothetical protein
MRLKIEEKNNNPETPICQAGSGGNSTGLKQNWSCKTNKRQKDKKTFFWQNLLA